MAPSQQLPKNWPPHIPYLTTPTYCPTITPSHLKLLRTPPTDSLPIPPSHSKGPCPLVKITPINDPSHPANGQSGLFASRDLKAGTLILQYIGEVHGAIDMNGADERLRREAKRHEESDYDLSLDREGGVGVDAQGRGNEARFVNDFRGVLGGRVNAEFREVWDGGRGERGMGVWVLGEKDGKGKGKKVGEGMGKGKGEGKGNGSAGGKWKGIRKGEEILVSYGRGFWGARKGEDEWAETVDERETLEV
ncbi:hypothetical protein SBOR_7103 [Sclerotinia borealis F-4128]|uniref:SET domain-containing protein n=1 Tax=Sclerotinia borealis (strain F-4128) TaxID=1432307 RepID=W9C9J1_SCLBF|nr:hypothetical protein SBOR_7103 [Sclerotinia borealis F-4128]